MAASGKSGELEGFLLAFHAARELDTISLSMFALYCLYRLSNASSCRAQKSAWECPVQNVKANTRCGRIQVTISTQWRKLVFSFDFSLRSCAWHSKTVLVTRGFYSEGSWFWLENKTNQMILGTTLLSKEKSISERNNLSIAI